MADDADIATDIAERERAALAVRPPAPKEPRAGAAICIECGEPIEPGRLAVLPPRPEMRLLRGSEAPMSEIGAALQPWGWALSLAVAALVAWIGWSLPRRFATVEALAAAIDARREGDAKLTKAIDDVIARVERVETTVKTLPSIEQIHDLALALERVSGRLDGTNTRLDGFGDLLRRTEEQVRLHAQIISDAGRKPA